MEIKKIKYTSKQGLSVELFEPDSFRLTWDEATMLLLMMKSHLTQSELDENFRPEEQAALERYEKLRLDKIVKTTHTMQDRITPVRKLHTELKQLLELYFENARQGWPEVVKDFLGWRINEPTPNHLLNSFSGQG
jgi:hypothetical protein